MKLGKKILPVTKDVYVSLIDIDDQNIILNKTKFECQICFTEINPGEGIILRGCLHEFCKECILGCIKSCEVAEVQCPFNDGNYKCDCTLEVILWCINIFYIICCIMAHIKGLQLTLS